MCAWFLVWLQVGMAGSSVGLATSGMPVSSIGFGYKWDACERWLVWLQV
jgi:hypothetical protein